MATRRDELATYGFHPEQPFAVRRLVSTSERGMKYSLALDPPADCGVYAVDGGLVREGCRCDKLVLVAPGAEADEAGEIFVELKGKNVAHAIEQLETTLAHPLFRPVLPQTRRWARIVARSYPRSTGHSVLERAKVRFKKLYRCDLRTCHSGQPERW